MINHPLWGKKTYIVGFYITHSLQPLTVVAMIQEIPTKSHAWITVKWPMAISCFFFFFRWCFFNGDFDGDFFSGL